MKTAITILFLVIPVAVIYSQTITDTLSENLPKGFQPGYVILADSTRLQGYIRNNIRHWATVQTLQHDGRKTTWTASQLREAVIHGNRYVVVEGEWYFVQESGARLNLLQKASAVSEGIQFNGTEPVGSTGSRGGYLDQFLQNAAQPDSLLIWITAANMEAMVRNLMAECEVLKQSLAGKKVSLKDLRELVRTYKECVNKN